MSRPDFLSPLVLSSPLANVDSQTLAAFPFLNPNKTAMLVDQFKITMTGNSNFISRTSKIDIMMGGIPLTNGLVPIAAMFPAFLGFNQGIALTGAYTSSSIFPGAIGPTQGQADYAFTCHLEKPLYVPYGTTFQVRIVGLNAGIAITGWYFSLAGRSLPANYPRPDTIVVPWMSGFAVDPTPTATYDALSFTCGDADLANPFDTPLIIKHLQGATEMDGRDETMVQITTSSNRAFIRDPMPFTVVFPADRLILPLTAKLDPKEFLRVELSLASPPPAGLYVGRTAVGMVGFRELPTPFAPGE